MDDAHGADADHVRKAGSGARVLAFTCLAAELGGDLADLPDTGGPDGMSHREQATGGAYGDPAAACDLIVAARTAMMGIPEAARSLVAVGGGCFRLPRRIPYHLAMELAITGKPWPATRFADGRADEHDHRTNPAVRPARGPPSTPAVVSTSS